MLGRDGLAFWSLEHVKVWRPMILWCAWNEFQHRSISCWDPHKNCLRNCPLRARRVLMTSCTDCVMSSSMNLPVRWVVARYYQKRREWVDSFCTQPTFWLLVPWQIICWARDLTEVTWIEEGISWEISKQSFFPVQAPKLSVYISFLLFKNSRYHCNVLMVRYLN